MFILLLLLWDLYLDPGSHHLLTTWGWDQKKETHVFKYARKLMTIQEYLVDMIGLLPIADHSVHTAFCWCLDVELPQARFLLFTDANSDVDWSGDAIDHYCT